MNATLTQRERARLEAAKKAKGLRGAAADIGISPVTLKCAISGNRLHPGTLAMIRNALEG